MDVAEFIRINPLLCASSPQTHARLAGMRRRRLAARQILFQHGDAPDAVYLLLSGRISICLQTLDGRQVALNTVGPGQIIGDIAVLDGNPRSASAIALSDCETAVVPRSDFLRLIDDDPLLARGLIARLCQDLRRVSQRVAADGFLDVQAGLAHRLLARPGMPASTGDEVAIDISQEELAQSVGVSRVTANKYLNQWQGRGWIKLTRGRITICDGAPLAGLIDRQIAGARLEGE